LWPQVVVALSECIGAFSPFDVVLSETGTFLGNPAYLWLKPEDGGVMKQIRDVLAERFPRFVPVPNLDRSFVPHVTVSVFDDARALAEAQQEIVRSLEPIHFRVSKFTYGVFDEDGGVVHLDSLPLGEG
jgi:2'-5' RNA ligase